MSFHDVADRIRQEEHLGAAAQFSHLCGLLALGRGSVDGAQSHAEGLSHPTPKGVADVLKAAVSASDISAATGFSRLAAGFLATLRQSSAFDAMLGSMVRVQPGAPIVTVTTTATSTLTEQGAHKPLSRIVLSADALKLQKVSGTVVVSRDQLRDSFPGTASLIGRELRRSIIHTTDQVLVSELPFGSPTIASSGPLADLSAALDAVAVGTASRLFILAGEAAAKSLTVAAETGSARVFPFMGPQGGEVAGIPAFTTAGLASDSWALVDAAAIVASAEQIRIDVAEEATIYLSDDPGEDGVGLTSLWQKNLAAIRAERWIAVHVARADAVAVVEGVNYAGGGD